MFGILLIVLVASIVYRAAEMDNRRGVLWASISIVITLLWGLFFPFGFAVGLFGTLLIMFVCNMVSGRPAG